MIERIILLGGALLPPSSTIPFDAADLSARTKAAEQKVPSL
jgi:hypothetical protein